VCRALVYLAPNHAINSVLKNLAASTFPSEYRRRVAQIQEEEQELHHKLPLFVLNVVLFPGMSLDLHVFEPRYRNLVSHTLASSRCFGIINGSSRVGCMAEINNHVRIPDGRSLLLVRGINRFSVLKRWENAEYGYDVAEVTLVKESNEQSPAGNDGSEEDGLARLAMEIRQIVQQKIPPSSMHTIQQQLGPLPASDPEAISFWIAAYLPVGLERHQALLEMTSTYDRLAKEKELLLQLNDRTFQQRVAPTVAPQRRPTEINFTIIIFFIILILWYTLSLVG